MTPEPLLRSLTPQTSAWTEPKRVISPTVAYHVKWVLHTHNYVLRGVKSRRIRDDGFQLFQSLESQSKSSELWCEKESIPSRAWTIKTSNWTQNQRNDRSTDRMMCDEIGVVTVQVHMIWSGVSWANTEHFGWILTKTWQWAFLWDEKLDFFWKVQRDRLEIYMNKMSTNVQADSISSKFLFWCWF